MLRLPDPSSLDQSVVCQLFAVDAEAREQDLCSVTAYVNSSHPARRASSIQ